MMRRQFLSMLVLSGAIALVASGCGGGKEVKVTGSVTQGGKPQEGVRIGFVPVDSTQGTPKGITTMAEGKFEVMLLPGSYKVSLVKMVDKKGNVPGDSENPSEDYTQLEASGLLRHAFPLQYIDPENSGIKVDIPPGGKNLEPFDVKK